MINIEEKIDNEVCNKCMHKNVCIYKSKMKEYQNALKEINDSFKEETNNCFSNIIRCKQYSYFGNDVILRQADGEYSVKKKAVKDVEDVIKRTIKNQK